MEDAESIQLSLTNHPNVAFFGVFDGHKYAFTAMFVNTNKHKFPAVVRLQVNGQPNGCTST